MDEDSSTELSVRHVQRVRHGIIVPRRDRPSRSTTVAVHRRNGHSGIQTLPFFLPFGGQSAANGGNLGAAPFPSLACSKHVTFGRQRLAPLCDEPLVGAADRADAAVEINKSERINAPVVL